MQKSIKLTFILFLLIVFCEAYSQWLPQLDFLSMNQPLTTISSKGNICVAAGTGGVIMYSHDKGNSWHGSMNDIGNIYNSVSMADENVGWATTTGGKIYKTENSGVSWTLQSSGVIVDMKGIFAVSTQIAYACGGGGSGASNASVVLKTVNGGSTWTPIMNVGGNMPSGAFGLNTSGTTTIYSVLYSCYFQDANTGYICGNLGSVPLANGAGGKIFKTTDGGATWSVTTFPATSQSLRSIYFSDANHGWAVGTNTAISPNPAGQLTRTVDGGVTWSNLINVGNTGTCTSVLGIDSNTVFVCNQSNANMAKSSDGGLTWTNALQGISGSIFSGFTKASDGLLLSGSVGQILKSTNNGTSWVAKNGGRVSGMHDAFFKDNLNGWVGNDGGKIMKTINGGKTWTDVSSPISTVSIQSLFFTSLSDGYAVGSATTPTQPAVKTNDGGLTWTVMPLPSNTTNQYDIYFPAPAVGFSVGASGTINKTNDFGASWAALTSGTTQSLQAVYFINNNEGWAVGGANTIIKTTDGGATWTPTGATPWATSTFIYDVWFADSNNGYICAASGRAAKTTDGGATWTQMIVPTSFNLWDMEWVNVNVGIIGGTSGVILSTNDGGANWSLLNPSLSSSIVEAVVLVPEVPGQSCTERDIYFFQSTSPTFVQGSIVKSTLSTLYVDNDMDGYGATATTSCGFMSGTGLSICGGDCNDMDNSINPSSPSNTSSSVANGQWNTLSTWTCGVPSGQSTQVNIGHAVNLNTMISIISNIEVLSTGHLTIVQGQTLNIGSPTSNRNLVLSAGSTLTIEDGARINVYGQLLASPNAIVNNFGGLNVKD